MTPPLVTVLLPVRNERKMFASAMDSILRQTLKDFEVVVVDDGSDDGTEDDARGFAERDGRVRVLRQKPSGQTAALNAGLALSRAEWVARMDADDWSDPERLELQIKASDGPGIVLVSADITVCDEDLSPVADVRLAFGNPALLRYLHTRNNPFCHSVMMFKKGAALAVGGYATERAQDYDLWIKLLSSGGLAHVPRPLLKYRVRRSSVSMTQYGRQLAQRNALSGRTSASMAGGSETPDARYFYRLAFAAWLDGNRPLFRRHAVSAWRSGASYAALSILWILHLFPRSWALLMAGYRGVYR